MHKFNQKQPFFIGTIEIYTDGAFVPYIFTDEKKYNEFKNKERDAILETFTNVRVYNRRLNKLVEQKYQSL